MSRPETWPAGTGELLPNTLFKLAAQYPNLTYAEYPKTPLSAGYRKITYREVANAVHAFAWWLEENVGKLHDDDASETMVYMGPNDLRYAIFALGSTMVGYKTLFPSPRYGAEALAKLISYTGSDIMLMPATQFSVIANVLLKRPMKTFQVPSVEELLNATTKPYPYNKTFSTHKNEVLMVLHTSGTTGFPKPIIWTHDWANSLAESFYLPAPEGYERMDGFLHGPQTRVMFMFPDFHSSGFHGTLFFPLFTGTTVVFPPAAATPHEHIVAMADALDVLDQACDIVAMPPPHMEFLSSTPVLLSRVAARIKKAMWAGGDVSLAASTAVSEKMDLIDDIGSTELGLWPALREVGSRDAKSIGSCHYMHFHPAMNMDYRPTSKVAEGQLFEAFLVRNKGKDAWVQPVFKIHTDKKEYPLGDLFTQHPQNPSLWKHYGRADDLLNFISDEKFYPGAAERRIAAHPNVEEVMMVGTRRPAAALIMKLAEGRSVDEVWSLIKEVNEDSPVYARVSQDMILTVTEPFPKTAKGSIQKKALLDLYEKELDELYAAPRIDGVLP